MPERIDLYRRAKRERSRREPMTTGKMWQVVVGLFLLCTGFAAALWLLGADLGSEYRRTALFTFPSFEGAEPRGTRLSICGVARTVLPGETLSEVPCIAWNLAGFYVVPLVALLFAMKASLLRR